VAAGDRCWAARAGRRWPCRATTALAGLYCADEGILISADALWQNGFGDLPELDGESGSPKRAPRWR
jgi:hypothetical protein